MRVNIQIEDGNAEITSEQPPGGAPEASQKTSGVAPPDALAARAAASGALSAGPAPVAGPGETGAPPLTSAAPGIPSAPPVGPTATGASADQEAGAAPMPLDGVQPDFVTMEEDEMDEEEAEE